MAPAIYTDMPDGMRLMAPIFCLLMRRLSPPPDDTPENQPLRHGISMSAECRFSKQCRDVRLYDDSFASSTYIYLTNDRHAAVMSDADRHRHANSEIDSHDVTPSKNTLSTLRRPDASI